MKKLTSITISFLLGLIFSQNVCAQTAIGTCSSLTVTNPGPTHENNLYIYSSYCYMPWAANCQVQLSGSGICTPLVRQYQLQKKNANNTWSIIVDYTWNGSSIFNNLQSGTYRVGIKTPIIHNYFTAGCLKTKVLNQPGQWVGHIGKYSEPTFTNEVNVGPTQPNQLNWNLIDQGTIPNNNFFNLLQDIKINTSGTVNYDRYWIDVTEIGGQNRWWSNGWTFAQMPSELNIRQLVGPAFQTNGNQFNVFPNASYKVQLAVMNGCNTSWVGKTETFVVCPSGVACRLAEQDIKIAPNPANSSFTLHNFDASMSEHFKLYLHDMTGRLVKSFEQVSSSEFDIAELNTGLYVVSLFEGDNKVLTSKLSVIK